MNLFRFVYSLAALLVATSTIVVAAPANLGLLKAQVKFYHDSGEYAADLARVALAADHYLLARIKKNVELDNPQKLALVLDLDETSFSNYPLMVDADLAATKSVLVSQMLDTKQAAILPILSLYNDALKNGVKVFFITGRTQKYEQNTIASLMHAGYKNWTKIYFKPEDYHQQSIALYKAAIREKITKSGYVVIASVGDQWSDLQGGFAERTFKLSNPYYFIA